jgi:DNA-binding transcriptional ArsR family regulator
LVRTLLARSKAAATRSFKKLGEKSVLSPSVPRSTKTPPLSIQCHGCDDIREDISREEIQCLSCFTFWVVAQPLCLYTFTRICSVEYIKRVESAFEIIAEPNRRAILSLLVSSQQSVGEIERQLRMPQPTVSKHLRVLREAGFVESTVDAQRRLYRLKPEPLQKVDAWLAPFRRFWSAHVDALERHLDRMDQSTPTKRKRRRRRRGPKPRT